MEEAETIDRDVEERTTATKKSSESSSSAEAAFAIAAMTFAVVGRKRELSGSLSGPYSSRGERGNQARREREREREQSKREKRVKFFLLV